MVRLTDRSGREMCLAMTHEEAATQLVREMVDSYRQLPVAIYQLQTKFRDEPRARGGLLRVREFTMKDAYSFHASEDDLAQFYQRMYRAYETVFERCELEVIAVESDQGMMGGSGAHEFMALMPVGEDTIIICDACGYRANRQVARSRQSVGLVEQEVSREEVATAGASPAGGVPVASTGDDCVHCGESLRAQRGVEVGNIFRLGIRYSERMNAGFLDDRGEWRPFVMGSYGIGPGRLMACIAQAHHDEHGLIWPRAVAPFDVVIVSLGNQKTPEVARAAQELYDELVESGITVLLDDRDVRAGVKFSDAELIGIPVRITVGVRGVAEGRLELKWRESKEEVRVPAREVSGLLRAHGAYSGG